MSVPCPGCQETMVEGKAMLCMECKDAGKTLAPDPSKVAEVHESIRALNPMEDCLWRMARNRERRGYHEAHYQMRRENGHTLGKIEDDIDKCDRDFAVLSKEWRSLDEHGKEALEAMSADQRMELIARAVDVWPMEHVRLLAEKVLEVYKRRSGDGASPKSPAHKGGNGTPVT